MPIMDEKLSISSIVKAIAIVRHDERGNGEDDDDDDDGGGDNDDDFSSLSLHESSVTCYLLHDAVAIVSATSCAHNLAVSIVKQHIGDDDQ